MKTLLTATAVSALMVTSAFADCPNGATYSGGVTGSPSAVIGFNALSISGAVPQQAFDTGTQTDSDCFTTGALSIGTGTAVSGVIVEDPSDPTQGIYQPPITAVYGQNSSAVGNGAFVGRVETYTNDNGTPDDPSDDTEETRLVPVNNGTALGAGSRVEHNGSTAVGAGAKSTAENQVTLGTKEDTISAPGVTSQKSKDRQTGSLEVVTTDANGNLASDGGAIFNTLSDHSAALASHQTQINRLNGKTDKAFEGVAMALAMESPQVDPGKRFGVSLNYGNFEGENALAAAAKFRFDDTWAGTAGVGYGMGQNTVGFRAGVQAQF